MERNREANVWQRVAAPPQQGAPRQDLRSLLLGTGERIAFFGSLRIQSARGQTRLTRLQELEQSNLACLKGMLLFSGGEGSLPKRTPAALPPRQILIRGYYLAKKAAAEYTARSVDPEFGVVFQEMASREITVCTLVTELLGELFF